MGGKKNWSLGWARCLLVTLSLIYPSLSGMCLSLPVRAYFLHLNIISCQTSSGAKATGIR